MSFFRRLFHFRKKYSKKDKRLVSAIVTIVGSKPFNLEPYKLSTQHTSIAKKSSNGFRESNERLEYLGDAVLGMVVADFLFKKFPYKDEGFLTEIRSRIVNRESLNDLAKKIGINKIAEYDAQRKNTYSHRSIYGDALEAFIGAVYLDRGFQFCEKFILQKLIYPHFDLEQTIKTNPNYKSTLIEWGQKQGKEVAFEIVETKSNRHFKEFIVQVSVDKEPASKGFGYNKKKAEQDAAKKCCEFLGIINTP